MTPVHTTFKFELILQGVALQDAVIMEDDGYKISPRFTWGFVRECFGDKMGFRSQHHEETYAD